MPPRHVMCLMIAAALLVPAIGLASQISYRPLREVLGGNPTIFVAKVTGVTRADTADEIAVVLTIKVLRVINGSTRAVSKITKLRYAERIPVIRDDRGNEVGRISMILQGSGGEFAVKLGDTVVAMTRLVPGNTALPVFRLEEGGHETRVRWTWGQVRAADRESRASSPAP